MRRSDNGRWWIPGHPFQDRCPIAWQTPELGILDLALEHVRKRDLCVQAGARVGLWPQQLAYRFSHVVTFEPEPKNFECAIRNLHKVANLELRPEALGRYEHVAYVEYSHLNDGCHQIVDEPTAKRVCTTTRVIMLDSVRLPALDLLVLDVEGYEIDALLGARRHIDSYRPVLVLEENRMGERYGRKAGALAKVCSELGYVQVGAHRQDLIFIPR